MLLYFFYMVYNYPFRSTCWTFLYIAHARNVFSAAVWIWDEKLGVGGNILHALHSQEGKGLSKTKYYQGHKGRTPWDSFNFIQRSLLQSLRLLEAWMCPLTLWHGCSNVAMVRISNHPYTWQAPICLHSLGCIALAFFPFCFHFTQL